MTTGIVLKFTISASIAGVVAGAGFLFSKTDYLYSGNNGYGEYDCLHKQMHNQTSGSTNGVIFSLTAGTSNL